MSPTLVVEPRVIEAFIRRNGFYSGEHIPAAWLRFLQVELGVQGYLFDLERMWLRSLGGAGDTLYDLWVDFLLQEGYAPNKQGMRLFFLNWTEDAGVAEFLLLESGDYLLLESGDKLTLEG